MSQQLFLRHSSRLDEQATVNGFVRHARALIVPAVQRRSLLASRCVSARGSLAGSLLARRYAEIAIGLERTIFTASREITRPGGRSVHRASQADGEAWASALRPKQCLRAIHGKLRKIIASKLILDWSPQQISGLLKIHFPMISAVMRQATNGRMLLADGPSDLMQRLSRFSTTPHVVLLHC